MADMSILFESEQAKAWLKKLQKKIAEVGKGPFAESVSPRIFQDLVRHFEGERGPEGTWAPWSPAYAIQAAKRGQRQVLQNTGTLRQALAPGNYREASEGIVFFNPMVYAHRHDEGTGGMPKRSFMWLSDEGMRATENVTIQFILDST